MSRCLGSSNQSRERKRGLSDAMGHDFLRKTGHVNPYAEQSAGQRLMASFLGIERDVRGGDVQGAEILVTERRLGDRRAGQAQGAQQFARGRVTLQPPAAEYASPEATLRIHAWAVRVAAADWQPREHALVR